MKNPDFDKFLKFLDLEQECVLLEFLSHAEQRLSDPSNVPFPVGSGQLVICWLRGLLSR
jgi:hypothetical protein